MEHHGRTDANANAIAPPAPVATTVRCIADFLEKLEPAGAGNDGARSRSAAMSWWRRRSACATPATGMAATAPGALPSPRRRWLGLGDRFHVVGFSRGGQIVWSCLAHIPHRLAGAVLVSPLANFWWRGFPGSVSSRAFAAQLAQDRWVVSVARHAPWLVYWWNTQRWFPPFSLIARDRRVYSPPDMNVISKLAAGPQHRPYRAEVKQQGVFEALHRDIRRLRRRILARLGHLLRGDGEAPGAVAAVPAAGVAHADRRLHQLMAADLDRAPSFPAPTLSPAVAPAW
ncbi:hypothetical protein BDA96_10G039700 [Sorghum bicolor]|jgi:pimeloyl-ACP methyl ester carboxylesterase|uniref:Serine aminopeptidase S33 domain-containing protein n=2 Tax=Sorghum bicolor TaxID=4558 RepID=C5Z3W4_SORBI|nr:hypothetical protein SORBI_3010G034400 [Sorghum bicolor]KAG0512736.1 hypothetical protein BDA96_10G039700 [Sorghum bicolor]